MDHADSTRLGNRVLLDKVDKLRELGISETVPLPQIVAAGEQSAGKSSLLESLTGISFPRAVTLCTRFATEIICRREGECRLAVTIQPDPGCSSAHAEKTRSFRRTVTSFTGDDFATIFEEASVAMGIRTNPKEDSKAPTFTRDVLRIEKTGPNEEHLTLIDVPGIFENESPGITTKNDIAMVKEMVKSYIKDQRTIILAVVPCNTDIATQTIIRFASEVDPEGKRTLGVLTKPDLAVEAATKNAVADLVRGLRRDLQLGYCIVRNRGADDNSATIDVVARNAQEREFFSHEPWSKLDASRIGIPALRSRLRELLMDRTKSEFPSVRKDMLEKLKEAQKCLTDLGESRGSTDEQRAYLGQIASRYNKLMRFGLDAYYTGDPIFLSRPDLRLITRVRELNESFAATFFAKGHLMDFELENDASRESADNATADSSDSKDSRSETTDAVIVSAPKSSSEPVGRNALCPITFRIPADGEENDLAGILASPFACDDPTGRSLLSQIEDIYKSYRGYELGTFGSDMIPTTFRLQATKWEAAALAHVSNAVLVVHHFIHELVGEACPDEAVRAELWSFLLDDLTGRYRRAMEHARFLLRVELDGKAVTCNPEFDRALREARGKRLAEDVEDLAVSIPGELRGVRGGLYIHLDDLDRDDTGGGSDAVCAKIHDVMKSYYDVARSRFIDNICVQAVDHFLLSGEASPLRVFDHNRVLSMTADQLEMIAGEDSATRNNRKMLKERIGLLDKALKILRG